MATPFWQKWPLSRRIWHFLYILQAFGTRERGSFTFCRAWELPPCTPGETGARERIQVRISARRGEIIDDLSDIRIVDRRA
jgi:hypothetical protein